MRGKIVAVSLLTVATVLAVANLAQGRVVCQKLGKQPTYASLVKLGKRERETLLRQQKYALGTDSASRYMHKSYLADNGPCGKSVNPHLVPVITLSKTKVVLGCKLKNGKKDGSWVTWKKFTGGFEEFTLGYYKNGKKNALWVTWRYTFWGKGMKVVVTSYQEWCHGKKHGHFYEGDYDPTMPGPPPGSESRWGHCNRGKCRQPAMHTR